MKRSRTVLPACKRAGALWSLATAALALALASCVAGRQDAGDAPLAVSLHNGGEVPLRCQLIFGHWVERGLGEIAPGADVRMDLMRAAADGGIYVMRPDGKKKMMVENVICGRADNWQPTLGQLDFTPLRQRAAPAAAAHCAAPADGGRVACAIDKISE